MTTDSHSHSSVGTTYPDIIAKVDKYTEELGKGHPDVMKGLQVLYDAAFKPGVLDTKVKELISLGISVAVHCDDCIAYHTRGALEAGASEAEIIEALGVALMMGAGISLAYSTHTFEAMEQFKAAKQ